MQPLSMYDESVTCVDVLVIRWGPLEYSELSGELQGHWSERFKGPAASPWSF